MAGTVKPTINLLQAQSQKLDETPVRIPPVKRTAKQAKKENLRPILKETKRNFSITSSKINEKKK